MSARATGYAYDVTPTGADRSGPRVAVFAPAPVLVCTFEHPADAGNPDVALNVGGQGPWVARAVTALGAHASLVVPLGGETGRAARHLLSDAPHDVREVDTQAAIACYVEERRDGERSCIREAPPGRFGQRELDDLYSAALATALAADVCVITGSPWADHLDPSLLTRLTADLAELERPTVADLSGAQLVAALEGGVDWLKVAHDELASLDLADPDPDLDIDGDHDVGVGVGEDGEGDDVDEAQAWKAAERLATTGRRRGVIVSRAHEPALVVVGEGEQRYRVQVPALTTVDARGSGDAMTAALATGLAERLPVEDLLRRAAAAGAANTVHKGSAAPDPRLVEQLSQAITVDAA
jgi:1-phosphofructokinase